MKIKENSNFKESFRKNRYAVVEISDMLTKPATWDFANGFAGTYSKETVDGTWERSKYTTTITTANYSSDHFRLISSNTND